MKFNKWTLGLAAIGAVSLTSAAHADEAQLSPLNTALSNTTISGYVDVGASYTPGNVSKGEGIPGIGSGNGVDSFNNVADIAIDKPLDESAWAAGYHVELTLGDDGYINSGYPHVRQAYVALRTPLGNGINWKFGIQDDIIGYESNSRGLNPNYTHSYGYGLEPTSLVGLIGTYQITDNITVQGGVAESYTSFFNGAPHIPPGAVPAVSSKTLVSAIALTAPSSWGWLQGATLSAGALLNLEKYGQDNYYAGVVLPTPISALKLGSSLDLASVANKTVGNSENDSAWDVAVYASYQATDKLALNLRGEYYDASGAFNPYLGLSNGKGEEITATVQYNLWANVISRAEFRWNHVDSGNAFASGSGAPGNANSFLLALNLVYQF